MKTVLLILASAITGGSILGAEPSADDSAPPQTWESGHFSLIPKAFQRDPHLDLSVITEVSDAGRALPRPSAGRPTYYEGVDSGLKEVGDLYAGERQPRPELLHEAMVKALRVNGYLPGDAAHPPTQVIYFVWGSYNKLTFTGTGDDLELKNLAERAALVGGQKFAVDFMQARSWGHAFVRSFKLKDPHNEWLVDLAEGNLYFIIATSYDYGAAAQHLKKILWRTKMSTDSNGLTMDMSVPTLVASSGAYFGKESPPVRLDRPAIREGHVEVGTPTVKNNEDPAAAKPSRVPGDNK